MPFTKTAREKRNARNAKIIELYRAGWTADRIATRGDVGGISAGGIRKVLQRAGVDRRAPGPQPGGGSAAPAPDDVSMIVCPMPECRREQPARIDQPDCVCGWQFLITRRSSGPRWSRTSIYAELDHHGMPHEVPGPGTF